MQYVSPISFLTAGGNALLSRREIMLAKRKLLAEFELQGTATISVGGKELSKSGVLKLFDRLENAKEMAYHLTVASDPAMLYFLEHAKFSGAFSLKDEKIAPGFMAWISPYFKHAFMKAALDAFRTRKVNEFSALARCPKWMTGQDEWEAWGAIEDQVYLLVKHLGSCAISRYPTRDDGPKYAGHDVYVMLLVLPPGRFSALRDAYAMELVKYAVRIAKQNQRRIWDYSHKQQKWAIKLVQYAKALSSYEETMQTIVRHEYDMKKQAKWSIWGAIIYFSAVLALLIFSYRIRPLFVITLMSMLVGPASRIIKIISGRLPNPA